MAEIVLAIGTSHSPMLNSAAEDHVRHAEIDQGRLAGWKRTLHDKAGQPATYDELLAKADPALVDLIAEEVIGPRVEKCGQCIDRLRDTIAGADLDALIVIGDDQHEQFFEDNMPSILIYWGDTIWNNILQLPDDAADWWKRARSQYYEETATREYPVAATLGRHLIERLVAIDFDISHAQKLPRDHGEGHAFGFVHRRLMGELPIPIVPVILNTYFPPNQPTPRRCYRLGQAIREAVASWPDGGQDGGRVGILASGGLSHFTVDEELDRLVLEACKSGDGEALMSIPTAQLNSGSSEIRNWIATAGAAEHLTTQWQEYVPCYRSAAGTGCGMAFAVWS
jgi:hypothetical protein